MPLKYLLILVSNIIRIKPVFRISAILRQAVTFIANMFSNDKVLWCFSSGLHHFHPEETSKSTPKLTRKISISEKLNLNTNLIRICNNIYRIISEYFEANHNNPINNRSKIALASFVGEPLSHAMFVLEVCLSNLTFLVAWYLVNCTF